MKLIVASGNEGKIREFREILPAYGFTVLGAKEAGIIMNVIEDGNSFFENAAKKAKYIAEKTGCAALADDSGLCVDALLGAPGIYSARYAGDQATDSENNDKLLATLKDIEKDKRGAYFASSVVICYPNGDIIEGYGETKGEILLKAEGNGGFGYDPLFYSYDLEKAFGLASSQEKNGISHRARAISDLCSKLQI